MKKERRAWLRPLPMMLMILLTVLAALPEGEAARAEGRKLTLMVYMCGSNLESSYGSASADIREMMDAGVSFRDVSVLVMTGGSHSRDSAGFFSEEATDIYEIGPGRVRRVQRWERPLNMGDRETLEKMIRFGMDSYPAEKYALILWDHGGGPLEGVCWDETHEMDHLSLGEIAGALENTLAGQRLSWIGFDACLMGSLEVASRLAPWAEYMIASQETEPAFGWNYSFLSGLHLDADGAETGRRIVDTYFEGREDSREILTLACVDLNAATEAVAALDPVFTPLEQRMGKEQFIALSGLRMSSTGFGKADPTAVSSGYDLVDAADLVSRMEENEYTRSLQEKLAAAVVYTRSNEEGAGGLSLYHPYANKAGYESRWKEEYEALPFSAGYQQYVQSFGGMLTGEILFRWMDLFARSAGRDAAGNALFEMQLTEEQAQNAVSAQLVILQDLKSDTLDRQCVLLATCPAEIGEDGKVRAAWDGRCLYAELENGHLVGPVPFQMTNDGKDSTVIGLYIPEGSYDLQGQMVLFEMNAEDRSEYPEIARIRVWDDVTESFSSRMAFSEEGYGTLMLYNFHRACPEIGADRVLPDYQSWQNESDLMVASTVKLPEKWRLTYRRLDSGVQCHAMFRLVDSQQNVICSLPAAVPNEYRRESAPVSGGIDGAKLKAELEKVEINSSRDEFGLHMCWRLENPGEKKISLQMRELTLNGSRMTDALVYEILQPGQAISVRRSFGRFDPAGLEKLESISGTAVIGEEGEEDVRIPFEFRFEDCDLTPISRIGEALAETEADGVRIRLLEISPDTEDEWNMTFLLENGGEGEFKESYHMTVDGIHAGSIELGPVAAGKSLIVTKALSNHVIAGPMFYVLELPEYSLVYPEQNVLQARGVTEIREIRFLREADFHQTKEFTMTLNTPFALGGRRRGGGAELLIPAVRPPEELADPAEESLPVLRENNVYRMALRRAVTGDKSIALTLELTNRSGLWLTIRTGDCSVNGEKTDTDYLVAILPPCTSRTACLTLMGEGLQAGTEIREIGLTFYDDAREEPTEPCVLTAPEGTAMGTLQWINGQEFTGETVRTADVDLEKEMNPRAVAMEMRLPEGAAEYRREVEMEMAPGERAQVRSAKISLIRPEEDGWVQLITLQDWKPEPDDGSGKLRFSHPGLFPTVEGDDQIGLWTYLTAADTGFSGRVLGPIDIFTSAGQSVKPDGIEWELKEAENRAELTALTLEETPYGYQSDLIYAGFATVEVQAAPGEDGTIPHVGKMEHKGGFEWYTKRPQIALDSQPLRLALRPITAEDGLCFLISITRQDGTQYSMPPVPYDE